MITQPESRATTAAAAGRRPPDHHFHQRLGRAIRRCARRYPASLLHLDVAAAWDVRDAGGKAAAAALREAVAGAVSAHLEEDAPMAPSGLCGFSLLLEGARPGQAVHRARSIKRAVDALRFEWHEHPFRLQACVGVLELGPYPEDVQLWLRSAREACCAARDMGGSGVQLVELNDHAWEDISRRREWVKHLSEIIG